MEAKSDAAFDALFKEYTATGMGGDMRFVDAFFSFLRRRTRLLHGAGGIKRIQDVAIKHVDLIKKEGAGAGAGAGAGSSSSSSGSSAGAGAGTGSASAKPAESAKSAASKPAAAAVPKKPSEAVKPAKPDEETPVEMLKDKDADEEDDEKDAAMPEGNGGKTDKYEWTQTLKETTVMIPLPGDCVKKSIVVEIEPTTFRLVLSTKAGEPAYIQGKWSEAVDSDDATWTIEPGKDGKKLLTLYLPKQNQMQWWKSVIKGDPEIKTKKIQPENSQLSDLDPDTRATVEKMMFDQRQKAAGKPSSDEMRKREMFEKFKLAHPEMDFSQAKFQE